jgi:hypothetical protein
MPNTTLGNISAETNENPKSFSWTADPGNTNGVNF